MENLGAKFGDAFFCHGITVWVLASTDFHSKAILVKVYMTDFFYLLDQIFPNVLISTAKKFFP